MASSALIALVGDGADLEPMRFTRRDITRHGRSLQALDQILSAPQNRGPLAFPVNRTLGR
jgi:hypothetical protein